MRRVCVERSSESARRDVIGDSDVPWSRCRVLVIGDQLSSCRAYDNNPKYPSYSRGGGRELGEATILERGDVGQRAEGAGRREEVKTFSGCEFQLRRHCHRPHLLLHPLLTWSPKR
jgi:hypothetical protein